MIESIDGTNEQYKELYEECRKILSEMNLPEIRLGTVTCVKPEPWHSFPRMMSSISEGVHPTHVMPYMLKNRIVTGEKTQIMKDLIHWEDNKDEPSNEEG